MELKFGSGSITDPASLFQSYLYGIEIDVKEGINKQLVVSIVPLWNWNEVRMIAILDQVMVSIVPLWNWNLRRTLPYFLYWSVSIVPLWNWNFVLWLLMVWSCCFNRTFMELKCVHVPHRWAAQGFQSYLYGIEIAIKRQAIKVVNLFQSYLYGIEIASRSKGPRDHRRVSIVPLWNWNIFNLIKYWKASMFQSYLYGIEIVIKFRKLLNEFSFNRTFMELKSLYTIVWLYVIVVSIVPLWNWNYYRIFEKSQLWQFQSYLYGIEM